MVINHHVHTNGSDGEYSPFEVVEAARRLGLAFIGINDHSPRSILPYKGNNFLSHEYFEEIRDIVSRDNGIEVSVGIELDWINGPVNGYKDLLQLHDFDYVLGSVHVIRNHEGLYFCTNYIQDGNTEDQIKLFGHQDNDLHEHHKDYVMEYFQQMRLMAESGLVDSVAHFDIIKRYDKGLRFFNQSIDFYSREVTNTLDAIRDNNLGLEINTSGFSQPCEEQYPSAWVIEEAYNRGIPITIGSDSHKLETLNFGLDLATDLARNAGYKEIYKTKNKERIKIPI